MRHLRGGHRLRMNTIAERVLQFWAPGSKRSKRVIVRIGAPEHLGRREDWAVSIEITGRGRMVS